jgi:hypothetical protein
MGREGRFLVGPVADVLTPQELSRLYGIGIDVERTPTGRVVVSALPGSTRKPAPDGPPPE